VRRSGKGASGKDEVGGAVNAIGQEIGQRCATPARREKKGPVRPEE
jgi:hypothetical protein